MSANIQQDTKQPIVRNNRKIRSGIVVSNKMNKTIVVLVEGKVKHPLYKKTINKSKKFKAHDETNQCGIGDTVEIIETRKLSKDKCWRLGKIIEKAK
jgi:small subunit ribosomal protein S17